MVLPLFGPKIGEEQKKKVIAVNVVGKFQNKICEFQNKKKRSSPLNWLVFSLNKDGKKIFTTNQ